MKNILIASDLVPTKSNYNLFIEGNIKKILGDWLYKIWNSAGFRIFNLETPLTNLTQPIVKNGPNLFAPIETINGIKMLKPNLITLANNHILDQGTQGLSSTINILRKNQINHIGAGENLENANNYHIKEINGKKVCFYALCENEFSVATNNTPGANPYDPLITFDEILKLKNDSDFLIILFHGGREHYRYPTPNLQKVCRKMVDKGANLVVVQHTHCIGCMEEYKDATIVYGQGNFIFDITNNEYWLTSLILDVKVADKLIVDYIPIMKDQNIIRIANSTEKSSILKDFYYRSNEIKNDDYIEEKFNNYVKQNMKNYLITLHGNNIILRLFNKLTRYRFINWLYRKRDFYKIKNYIDCETHLEILRKSIDTFITKI